MGSKYNFVILQVLEQRDVLTLISISFDSFVMFLLLRLPILTWIITSLNLVISN